MPLGRGRIDPASAGPGGRAERERASQSDEIRTVPSTKVDGAGSRIRTDDRLITNQVLYQLSYTGVSDLKLS